MSPSEAAQNAVAALTILRRLPVGANVVRDPDARYQRVLARIAACPHPAEALTRDEPCLWWECSTCHRIVSDEVVAAYRSGSLVLP